VAESVELIAHGLEELQREFARIERTIEKDTRKALRAAAWPVARSARSKLARYRGASIMTIRPKAIAHGALVVQNARKVTGLRPDFAELQLTRVLEPALEENEDKVIATLEAMLAERLASL
jgi:hypothetical protein